MTVNSESGLSAEYVLGTSVIMRGAYGSRPAASKSGLLYMASDNVSSGLTLYRDNGSSWDALTNVGPFANKSVLFIAGSSGQFTQDNTNFCWDDTNNRLGIGTCSPNLELEVSDTNTNTILGITSLGTGQYSILDFVDESGTGNAGYLRYDHNSDRFEWGINGGTFGLAYNGTSLTSGGGSPAGGLLEGIKSAAASDLDVLRLENTSTAASANGVRALMIADGENNTGDVFLRMIAKNGGASEANWSIGIDTSDSRVFKINSGATLGTSTFTMDPSGTGVGFGTSSITRPVTINDSMRLVPRATAPSSPVSGDIYVDSTPSPDELCFYDGAAWQGISSGTDANCA